MQTAATVVDELVELIEQGHEVAPGTIEAVTGALDAHESPAEILEDVVWRHRNTKVAPKTLNQKRYVDSIRRHTITFGIGPAGTGKTFLAVAMAAAALAEREVQRIILTRPAVEAGERLGFLPGDIQAKVDPYLRPLFDALYDMLDPDRVNGYFERGVIEVAPLAFMRGRTLNDSFVILDEAQNTSPEQMKMFLTRLGFNSRMVVTGDITQIDLPTDQRSGLVVVRDILDEVQDISFVRFGGEDVVRHKLVQRIVAAYGGTASASGRARRAAPIAELERSTSRDVPAELREAGRARRCRGRGRGRPPRGRARRRRRGSASSTASIAAGTRRPTSSPSRSTAPARPPARASSATSRSAPSTAPTSTEAAVHGALHLCGYDHETDDGEMLALQDARCMAGSGERADPLPASSGSRAGRTSASRRWSTRSSAATSRSSRCGRRRPGGRSAASPPTPRPAASSSSSTCPACSARATSSPSACSGGSSASSPTPTSPCSSSTARRGSAPATASSPAPCSAPTPASRRSAPSTRPTGSGPNELVPVLAEAAELDGVDEVFPISARTGEGLDELVARLGELVPEGPFLYPPEDHSDQSSELLLAELIREQVLNRTREEIPHSVEVKVGEIAARDDGLVTVRAEIWAETESQKGILIGKGGAKVGEIGTAARRSLEAELGAKVHLDLQVRVRRRWRRDEDLLDRLGIE